MLAPSNGHFRKLPAHIARAIAVAALTDPRTVARVVAGRPTRAATRDRILRALRSHQEERKALDTKLVSQEL